MKHTRTRVKTSNEAEMLVLSLLEHALLGDNCLVCNLHSELVLVYFWPGLTLLHIFTCSCL